MLLPPPDLEENNAPDNPLEITPSQEASRLAAWVENGTISPYLPRHILRNLGLCPMSYSWGFLSAGIADALEKNYLHKCLFGFAADADAQHLLEQVNKDRMHD